MALNLCAQRPPSPNSDLFLWGENLETGELWITQVLRTPPLQKIKKQKATGFYITKDVCISSYEKF